MPDTFSASVGISVLAGIISGVCYVIVYRNKITNKRNKQWHCTVCGKNFKSTDLVLSNSELVVECSKCNSKICKSKCSFLEPNDLYICRTCYNKTNNWINGAFKVIEPITKVLRAKMSYSENSNNEYMDNLEATREKEQVRDFIERLVNNILGENVDDACINKIYDDSNYLPIVGESPRSANSSLKLIIQKIIREAAGLPKLKGEGTNEASEQEKRTYEDLLSTAILNKIISSSQSNLTSRSSRANSVSSHRSTSSRRKKYHKEYFFGEEAINNKWKDTDTASVSSLDEWVHSDSSLGSTKYVDRLSLTIKQRIEEVSSSESDQEADLEENNDAEYFGTQSYLNVDDQPNWFLQRRKFRGGAISPVPVPMLVPDPTNEAKVLIGDKELDDTSDLSDIPSDFEEEINKNVLSMDIKNHLIGSKNLIGGKNSLADLSLVFSDDDVSADSGVKECKDLDDVDSEMFVSNKHDRENADESICSDESNNERDLEYTERYATLPRTILISPKAERKLDDSTKAQKNDNIQTNGLKGEAEEKNESEFTGLYSRREKKKWKNAVELKNNPYSKENIEKRIKSRNSINSLFGSDYYVRQASLPSGAKKSEVSLGKPLNELEENYIFASLPRTLYTPQESSKNFVKNPLLNFPKS